MRKVKDIRWEEGQEASVLVAQLSSTGFQASNLDRAASIITDMRRNDAKVYLSFTSNMVTSGLRGLFAQAIELGVVDVVVTTTGAIEEDIMKSLGEDFLIADGPSDDTSLHESGLNRIGNLMVANESYARFEDFMIPVLGEICKSTSRLTATELLRELGLRLDDERSILFQAAKKGVPVFCPAITDGSLGFQLYTFSQDHPDFVVDVVRDFSHLLGASSHDDRKGVIALGGGVSKHHAIFGLLLNGGSDYAVYMTTSAPHSGSTGGATTSEAKTWGKVKMDAREATVIGDVSITFPMVMFKALDDMRKEGLI